MKNLEKLTLEILKELPKAELHCHLDGSVRISTILDLAKIQGVELPANTEEDLRKLVSVDADCESLVEYLRGFSITLSVMQTKHSITRCFYELCEDAVADGVRYIEIRFSPILHTEKGLSLSGVMDAVCEGIVVVESKLPITPRIIVCGMRHLPAETTTQLAEIAWRFKSRGVVAFDLAGPEDGFSSKHHREAFNVVRNKMLNCTLHSGEAYGWESIHDSIFYCGAQRLGHGVALQQNETLLNYVIDRRMPIEVCLTSNLQTKAITSLESHPIKDFFDQGVVVVPCTDNPTVSNVTLSGEYLLLQEVFGFGVMDIVRMIDYGFRSTFCEMTVKRQIRAESLSKCFKILEKHHFKLPNFCNPESVDALDSASLAELEFAELPSLFCADEEQKPEIFQMQPTSVIHNQRFFEKSHRRYSLITQGPGLSLSVIHNLYKPDIHCRLDGSVSIKLLWEFFCGSKDSGDVLLKDYEFKDEKAFRKFIQPDNHTSVEHDQSRKLMRLLLQTPDRLRRGTKDVIKSAADENVVYLELHVRPLAHIIGGHISPKETLRIVQEAAIEAESEHDIRVSIVVYVDLLEDSRMTIYDIAKLAVSMSRSSDGSKVRGFGFFGGEMADTVVDGKHEYKEVFDYLKAQHFNVTISAGRQDPLTVVTAVHEGGATRISGGYKCHAEPLVLGHLASFAYPVEIGFNQTFQSETKESKAFGSNVINLFLDNEVRVSLCSFDMTLYDQTRSEQLYQLIVECGLQVHDVLNMLATGFRRSYLHLQERKMMYSKYWHLNTDYLVDHGYGNFKEPHFIPPDVSPKPRLNVDQEKARALRYLK